MQSAPITISAPVTGPVPALTTLAAVDPGLHARIEELEARLELADLKSENQRLMKELMVVSAGQIGSDDPPFLVQVKEICDRWEATISTSRGDTPKPELPWRHVLWEEEPEMNMEEMRKEVERLKTQNEWMREDLEEGLFNSMSKMDGMKEDGLQDGKVLDDTPEAEDVVGEELSKRQKKQMKKRRQKERKKEEKKWTGGDGGKKNKGPGRMIC